MNINWTKIGEGDYEATYGKYRLRIEMMDRNLWWFQVYENDKELIDDMTFTFEEAERIILKHIRSRK